MIVRNIVTTAFALICMAGSLRGHSRQNREPSRTQCFQYQPAQTTLGGELVIEMKFGPPGYGDNPKRDRKVRIYVLRLDSRICVEGSGDYGTERNVKEIEVFFRRKSGPDSWDAAHVAIGKRVRATGELRQSMMGFEYTKVVMDVRRLSVVATR